MFINNIDLNKLNRGFEEKDARKSDGIRCILFSEMLKQMNVDT